MASRVTSTKTSVLAGELLRALNRANLDALPEGIGFGGAAGGTRWAVLRLVLGMMGPNLAWTFKDGTPALGLAAGTIAQASPWNDRTVGRALIWLERAEWLITQKRYDNSKLLAPCDNNLEALERCGRKTLNEEGWPDWETCVVQTAYPRRHHSVATSSPQRSYVVTTAPKYQSINSKGTEQGTEDKKDIETHRGVPVLSESCLNKEDVQLGGNVCESNGCPAEGASEENNVCPNPGAFRMGTLRHSSDDRPEFSSEHERYIQSKGQDPSAVWRTFFNGGFPGSTIDEAIAFLGSGGEDEDF